MSDPPVPKRARLDGNLDAVDQSVIIASRDHDKWIAERKKNWPTRQRVAEKLAQASEPPGIRKEDEKADGIAMPKDVQKPTGPKRITCRYFLKGRCNAGGNCRFSHEQSTSVSRPAHERVYKRFEPPTRAPLFVKLMQTDHDAEDRKLLLFIEYLHSQGILKQELAKNKTPSS